MESGTSLARTDSRFIDLIKECDELIAGNFNGRWSYCLSLCIYSMSSFLSCIVIRFWFYSYGEPNKSIYYVCNEDWFYFYFFRCSFFTLKLTGIFWPIYATWLNFNCQNLCALTHSFFIMLYIGLIQLQNIDSLNLSLM